MGLRSLIEPSKGPTGKGIYKGDALKSFDVVTFQNPSTRALFRNKVSMFHCPADVQETEVGKDQWYKLRHLIEGEATKRYIPAIAMRQGTPCAAALYLDTEITNFTYLLIELISNAGENCVGGTGAILCHLIRNSKETVWGRNDTYSPVTIYPNETVRLAYGVDPDEQPLEEMYYEFGCIGYTIMDCIFAEPPNCDCYSDMAFTAESYFLNDLRRSSKLLLHRWLSVCSIPALLMIGCFASGGLCFGLRHAGPAGGQELLLAS
eukprot:gnl/TRDRNA2_/TRDRNA2_85441_c0_seq2.p1 gnl/TRDRNA2_/TRDRNA2_85441_c0~~gnl/TRDRNA2_/TRDRNA2_85441_c0_seq2.p1  ORF type:complete len:263 (+),score=17.12 gnl/TRDRNA2_/TRDRNA2_85441_c0_seq2:37-825(+)